MPKSNRIKDKFPVKSRKKRKYTFAPRNPVDQVLPELFVVEKNGDITIALFEYDEATGSVYFWESPQKPSGGSGDEEQEDESGDTCDQEDTDDSEGSGSPEQESLEKKLPDHIKAISIDDLLEQLDPYEQEVMQERFKQYGIYGILIIFENTHLFKFESLNDILRSYRDKLPEYHNNVASKSKDGYYGEDLSDWDKVTALIKKGYPKGVETFNQMLAELMDVDLPQPPSNQRRRQFAELNGEDLDYDRFRAGQDYWGKMIKETSVGMSEYSIFIDLTCAFFIKPKDAFWRGVAALCLLYLLEQQGFRVELWTIVGTRGWMTEHRGVIACRLKRLGDPLNIDSLVMSVATWMFRSVYVPVSSIILDNLNGGKFTAPYVASPTLEELDHLSPDQNKIYAIDFFSKQEARKFVVDELTKIREKHR